MVWTIFLILAFGFVIWLFYQAFTTEGSSNHIKKEEELEILKGRFARGEINEEEFKRRKSKLVGNKTI